MGKNSTRTQRTWTKKEKSLINIKTLRDELYPSAQIAAQFKNMYEAISIPLDMYNESLEVIKEDFPNFSPKEVEEIARKDAKQEWIAANVVDFYNEISLLYGLVEEYHAEEYPNKDQGFPPGFKYALPGKSGLNGAEYVTSVFSWIEDQIEDPSIFPETSDEKFPDNFVEYHAATIFKRLLRVYAIMYAKCLPAFKEIDAVKHVNTCFTHFYFYVKRWELVSKTQEYEAFSAKTNKIVNIKDLQDRFTKNKKDYIAQVGETKSLFQSA